jgi:hypothetical protein
MSSRGSATMASAAAASTSALAPSFSKPVASPVAGSRMISPPGGLGVAASMPASASAASLAQRLWCESSRSITGRPPAASSSARRAAGVSSGSRSLPQMPPTIHSPGAFLAAAARTRSSGRMGGKQVSYSSARPAKTKWLCTSIRPGITMRPCRSTSRAPGTAARACARLPTASRCPSRTAKASAQGRLGSIVYTAALRTR